MYNSNLSSLQKQNPKKVVKSKRFIWVRLAQAISPNSNWINLCRPFPSRNANIRRISDVIIMPGTLLLLPIIYLSQSGWAKGRSSRGHTNEKSWPFHWVKHFTIEVKFKGNFGHGKFNKFDCWICSRKNREKSFLLTLFSDWSSPFLCRMKCSCTLPHIEWYIYLLLKLNI